MEKKRSTRLSVDLLELKQPWLDWCAARDNITPSKAFRQIVQRLVTPAGERMQAEEKARAALAAVQQPRTIKHEAAEKPTVRREFMLTQSEAAILDARAAAEGFSPTRWIVALVRARLTGTAQYGQRELELLDRSNMRLLAIGRNLNQVAKALNSTPADYSRFRVDLIEELQRDIKEHARTVSDAIAANVSRWRIE